jgi:Leucine-rich repeat (LRR) protein
VALEQSGLSLNLSNLALCAVPSGVIDELPPLASINLSNNFISCLSTSMRLLTDLKSLDLSHNLLASFSHTQHERGGGGGGGGRGASPFLHLEGLNLSHNRLWCVDQLPTTLTELNVANNVIEKLPPDFSSLTNLRVLDLSRNRLTTDQGIP